MKTTWAMFILEQRIVVSPVSLKSGTRQGRFTLCRLTKSEISALNFTSSMFFYHALNVSNMNRVRTDHYRTKSLI